MPEIIIGSPNQNMLFIGSHGEIITTGSNAMLESFPTDSNMNNPYITLEYISSGAGTGIDTGSSIGSITQFIGTGSYVKSLTYSNNNLINIGSWT